VDESIPPISILESPVALEENQGLGPSCDNQSDRTVGSVAVGQLTIVNSSDQTADIGFSALIDGVSIRAYEVTLGDDQDEELDSCTVVDQPTVEANTVSSRRVAVEVDPEMSLPVSGTFAVVAKWATPDATEVETVELAYAELEVAEPDVPPENAWGWVVGVPGGLSAILFLVLWVWVRDVKRQPSGEAMGLGDRLATHPDFSKAPGFNYTVIAAAFAAVLSLTALRDVERLSSTLLAVSSASLGLVAAFSRFFYFASRFYGTRPEGKRWPRADSEEKSFTESPPGRVWGWFAHIALLTLAILGLLVLVGMVVVYAWNSYREWLALGALVVLGVIVILYAYGTARDLVMRQPPKEGVPDAIEMAIAAAARKYAENRNWQAALEHAARAVRDNKPG
jgi:hypothetical protein